MDWSRRRLTLYQPSGPALVLGSTQPRAHVDAGAAAAAGVEVVRRRSGGSAVLVEPGHLVWVEVVVPAGDALWDHDVGRAAWWLGAAWAAALADLGHPGGAVHRAGLRRGPWSERLCFAGIGPGEVTLGPAKVVGLAQRRTRHGAVFSCALPLVWDPGRHAALLALTPAERAALTAAVADVVRPPAGLGADAVVDALAAHLPGGGA